MAESKKRSYDVSELEIDEDATVHGKVLELSPIKISRNRRDCLYFNGKLSDGVKMARFVSFERKLRECLDKFLQENKSVVVSGCRIQSNKYDRSKEIITGRSSVVGQSPKKFKIDESAGSCSSLPATVQLSEIANTAVNECYCCW